MFRAVLVFLLMTLVPASFAVEPSEQFTSCMDDSGGVTASMLDCIGQENQRVDGKLNALWQTELPKQDTDFKDMLRASQRAWIAYRDATCDVEGALYGGGSLAGVAYSDCHRQLTTASYFALNWVIANQQPDAEFSLAGVQRQVSTAMQGDPGFQALDEAGRQEFAEVLMMNFLLQQAVLSDAYVRGDAQMMQQMAGAAVARFKSEMGIDLRTLKPTSAGLVASTP